MNSSRERSFELDTLLAQIAEHWTEIRHVESQRDRITGLVAVISSGTVAVSVSSDGAIAEWPLGVVLLFAASLGLLASEKLYERYRFLQNRLDAWYKHMAESVQCELLFSVRDAADRSHYASFRPRLFIKLPLHGIWSALHVGIMIAGLLMIIS